MKKDYSSIFASLFILMILGFIYFTMMPHWISNENESLSEFSTKRALIHVEVLSKQPHYVGTPNHQVVADYLIKELRHLGLQTSIQEGFTLSDWGNLVKSKNILARIKGNYSSKALLLLSHYDSAPHSFSHGASDDASGVATILESVRAFLHTNKRHKNDIIILFSDAEELGLNGAALFVTQHPWAKNVGLVLNFEARGSSGPSYMLMETNKGNQGLVKEFASAKATFPVSNSLMYSIYKMLPNDTDLTVFREQGNIQGYNFAFIDDHFNYHTAQDDIKHLNKNTLAHQGTYLMPFLNYFSNADLNTTLAAADDVYFTIPYTFIFYPFSWVLLMVVIALTLFIFLLFLGRAKHILSFREIARGFIPFLGSIIITGLITFFGWKALLKVYPQYNDLLNGFTYNGHAYIVAFVLLAVAICFTFYQHFSAKKVTMNHYVAPLLIWIIINGFIAFSLQGAGFLIIPVYFALISFGIFIVTQKSNKILNLICGIPALLIIAPFIQMFPVGLGLKVLFGSALLTVLTFALLLPVFGAFAKKGRWSSVFFILAIAFFVKAHYSSGYEFGKAKSNSLLYVYNKDTNKASWMTYDTNLDSWTKNYLGEKPKQATAMEDTPLFSKYNSKFTYQADAPIKVLEKPTIEFLEDRIIGNQRYLKMRISPNRKVNRYDIFANEKMTLHNFKANGASTLGQKGSKYKRNGKKILSYYVIDNLPLEMQFSMDATTNLDMALMESSFDLMTNPLFSMKKRENWMMPTPFILNDAVVINEKIKSSPVVVVVKPVVTPTKNYIKKEPLIILTDSLKVPKI
ncbi:M20/M25/M40 family metallo-hydrolase [Flavobacterium sp. LB3P45]|uniref:Vacuolar membrane protease n=1 Tax=Flavobacterium fructosi TaxID=3230416 RepID=A0ABW6HJI8_9FLAO